jgi:hypothetical protein
LAQETVIDVLCNGDANGAILLAVSGGQAPYTYSWSSLETTRDITGKVAGLYSVTITDANGCTLELNDIEVEEPDELLLDGMNTITEMVSCFGGNDGEISLAVSGGTLPYSYLWSNGATTAAIMNIIAGSYSVTVTDANGCFFTETFIIAEPSELLVSGTTTNIVCFGDATGEIQTSVMGGVGLYTYAWSDGPSTDPNRTGLMAGNYTVSVTDENACTATTQFTINQNDDISISGFITAVSCNGGMDGEISLTVNGGVSPYTFAWTGSGTGDNPRTGLVTGSYSVTVTDSEGCEQTAMFMVGEPDVLELSGTTSNVSCNAANDGAISLMVMGGTAPFLYVWSNGAGTADISGLAPGTYSVTVTDVNGCEDTESFMITQPDELTASGTVVTNCPSDNQWFYRAFG